MNLCMVMPTLQMSRWRENHASWGLEEKPWVRTFVVANTRPLTTAYQEGYEQAGDADVIGFVHDDVTCLDPQWEARVMWEFRDPMVGLVGFGGSTGHGNAEIYKIPYEWQQVGREGEFMSNMVNAEQHGSRMTGSAAACCLDGFAMFVRKAVLDASPFGGWPLGTPIQYYGYDYWLSCETRRQGFGIRVVGVACEHSAPSEFRSYVIEQPAEVSHEWLYFHYRDTFPARLPK